VPRFEVTVNTAVPGSPGAGVSVRRTVAASDHCDAAMQVLDSVLVPDMVGIWCVRRRGALRFRRRWTGRFGGFGGFGDAGLSGVREPRRPAPSAGSASAALELPAA
jgi:hypothetical protein